MLKRFLIIAIVAITACQPDPIVVDNVPVADTKLVVSSVAWGDQLLNLFITKSYGALDGDITEDNEILQRYLVPDAEVWVRYEGEEVLLQSTGIGIYGTDDISLDPGTEYELEVYDPETNQTVTSSTEMTESVSFGDVSLEMETESIDTLIRVKYEFTDNPGESYYMINVQRASQRFNTPEEILSNRVHTHLIDDKDIADGSVISDEFIALFRFVSFGDTVLVSLSNISPEYYNYLESVNNGFLGPSLITEPFNYTTNIEGGYGFFNLYNRDQRFMLLLD